MVARNLLIPFRRDRKRDLATGESEALLASKVRQVLLTEGSTPTSSGELPWRTNFGAGLALLRHHGNGPVLAELLRVRVRDALGRWAPAVELISIDVVSSDEVPSIIVSVRDRAMIRTEVPLHL
jgi:hypothetical protein